ncbi:MAG: hypothetical protein JSS66_16020 [Armatimonadetes bacterium]|nr:hypothetical protein [Armatimonadota bacterium]
MNNRQKNLLLWVLAVGCLSTVAFLLATLLNPETLESVGRRAANCYLNDDGGCLYSLACEDEKELLALSPSKVQAVLDEYTRPAMGPVVAIETHYEPISSFQGLTVCRLRHKNREESTLTFSTIKTDKGIRCWNVMRALVFDAGQFKHRLETDEIPIKSAMTARAILMYEKDGGVLDRLGLAGIIKRPSGFESWHDAAVRLRKRYVKDPERSQ